MMMTEGDLDILYDWQLYVLIIEGFGLKPTTEGFIKFRRTRWTKERCTPERVKQCEEVTA